MYVDLLTYMKSRYIGKLCNLYPVDDHLMAAYIDSIVDEEIDLFTGLSASRYRCTVVSYTNAYSTIYL